MPTIMLAPEDPAIPDAHRGRQVVYLSVVRSGPPDAGEQALAPLRTVAAPMSDTIAPKPYPDLFSPVDPDEGPTWAISSRALFLDALDDTMIDVIERRLTEPGRTRGDPPSPRPGRRDGARPG